MNKPKHRKVKSERKERNVSVWVTEDDHKAFKVKAGDLSVGTWARVELLKAARS